MEFKEQDKVHFFGIYDEEHTGFRFSDFDRILIAKLVQYVKNISEIDKNLHFFSQRDDFLFSDEWFFKTTKNQSVKQQSHTTNDHLTLTHRVLHKLLATADKNASTSKGGYRFDEEVKSYASYLRMLAGPLAYETLQKNLPLALPSLSSTNRFVGRTHHNIIEGQLRCDELLIYLKNRNLPLAVSLSEDATRVINRVQYDSSTNQLIGFVLPTDQNGLPIPFSYKARSTNEIVEHYSRQIPISGHINTVMAKPFGGAPSFCLLIYGSDGKYTAIDVSNRWKFITAELKKLGIIVLTISSDSDPRYNSSMRLNSNLGIVTTSILRKKWFACGNNIDWPFYVQDTVHLLTKLRNFFLKSNGKYLKRLPFGNEKFITVNHLEYLKNTVGKDKHGLTNTTLNPIDRQNFASAEKMCDSRVIRLLHERVENSEATAKFLEIMRNVIEAFMDESLSPQERIRKIWYSVFLVRLWRQFIEKSKTLTLKDNFLTANCYSCLELNAHSLIFIIVFLRKSNSKQFFMLKNFSSQPCEEFYRQIRSFTTVYSTMANCTTKEAIGRVKKIQLQSDISTSNTEFLFPRNLCSNDSSKENSFEMPTESEIIDIVENCKTSAINDAIGFGLLKKPLSNIPCEIVPYVPKTSGIEKKFASMAISEEIEKKISLNDVLLKNFANKFATKEVSDKSSYVEIHGGNKRLVVKKTSLCWLLNRESVKLSSDRLERVKNSYLRKNVNPKNVTRKTKIARKLKKRPKKIKRLVFPNY